MVSTRNVNGFPCFNLNTNTCYHTARDPNYVPMCIVSVEQDYF